MYYKGEGVQKNSGMAVEWFRKAANQGHIKSQYNLEAMYSNDENIYQDNLGLKQISEPVLPEFVRSSTIAEHPVITAHPNAYEILLKAEEANIEIAKDRADLAEISASIKNGTKLENLMERLAKQGAVSYTHLTLPTILRV